MSVPTVSPVPSLAARPRPFQERSKASQSKAVERAAKSAGRKYAVLSAQVGSIATWLAGLGAEERAAALAQAPGVFRDDLKQRLAHVGVE